MVHFCSEFKQWYNFWDKKTNNVSGEIHGASESRKKVDGKPGFTLGDPPDGMIEALNLLILISFLIYVNCSS